MSSSYGFSMPIDRKLGMQIAHASRVEQSYSLRQPQHTHHNNYDTASVNSAATFSSRISLLKSKFRRSPASSSKQTLRSQLRFGL